MSLDNTSAGFNWTNEYVVSAMPWVTGSLAVDGTEPTRLRFPKVTKYVKVKAVTNPVKLGFTHNGVSGSNYFSVPAGQTETFDVRVKEIYLLGDGGTATTDVFAGLTLIPSKEMSVLTGSTDTQAMGSGWQGVG